MLQKFELKSSRVLSICRAMISTYSINITILEFRTAAALINYRKFEAWNEVDNYDYSCVNRRTGEFFLLNHKRISLIWRAMFSTYPLIRTILGNQDPCSVKLNSSRIVSVCRAMFSTWSIQTAILVIKSAVTLI